MQVNMAGAETGGPRVYRSQLRQRQAAETRRRVVAAAGQVFSENGFQAATFAQIAKEAGVSIETVRSHGPKAALMWAAVEVASFGVEGDIEIFDTDIGQALLALGDPAAFAAFLGTTMLALNEPVAGVWTAVTGAAHGDAELRAHLLDRLARIRGQVEKVLRWVAGRGWLRTDVPFDDLVEAACVITSVETYVRFVRLDGRSPEQYKEFLTRTVRDTILVPASR
jgi:AcrR family transcriptional regulator